MLTLEDAEPIVMGMAQHTDDLGEGSTGGDAGGGVASGHHLPEAVLLDYAAGAISGPTALLVASHLAFCARCRGDAASLDAVGGTLLAEIEPAAVAPALLHSVLARIDEMPVTAAPSPQNLAPADADLPAPLRRALGRPLGRLAWKPFLPGLRQVRVLADKGDVARLMLIRPGAAFPRHTHGGLELTLVLRGGYSDEIGRFRAGDVSVADGSVRHRPKADPGEDCLCLLVSEAPLRLTGWIGRWFNPVIPF